MKLSALPVMSYILLFSMFLPIISIHTAFREIQKLMGNIWNGFACCRYFPYLDMEHRHSIHWVVDSKLQVAPWQPIMLCFSMLLASLTASSGWQYIPCWWWVLVVQFPPLEIPECPLYWAVSTQLWAQRCDRKCWVPLCPRETQPFFRY